MAIKVTLIGPFSQETGWQRVHEVAGTIPLECLQNLEAKFPGIRKWIYDKHGDMLIIFQIYVNKRLISEDEYSNPINDDDELWFMFNFLGIRYGGWVMKYNLN